MGYSNSYADQVEKKLARQGYEGNELQRRKQDALGIKEPIRISTKGLSKKETNELRTDTDAAQQ